MVRQSQSVCMECQGHEERISPKDRRKSCNGRKTVREKKILEVHIEKGMKDGQKVTFHGQIVKHGDIKCVLNEGMPIYHRPYEKGRLIIEFKVNFPENGFLSPDKLPLLEKLLPERKEVEETDEMDQVELVALIQIRKDGAIAMEKHMRMMTITPEVLFSVRPLNGP
ncbi:hypothetical protein P7K49_005534, partial [Saguinus oedipus]